MGNASFANHAHTFSLASLAALPQAFLVYLGFPFMVVIVAGDFFFPFILSFLLCYIAMSVGVSRVQALLFSATFMVYWSTAWLRIVNPQITMTIFFLGLLLFLQDRQCRFSWLRGTVLAVAMIVQPIHAALLLSIEFFDACLAFCSTSFRSLMRLRLPIVCIVTVACLFIFISMMMGDSVALVDTAFRRGFISSHLPAAPSLQLSVLLALVAWMYAVYAKRVSIEYASTFFVLLGACLLVLNQSILHGRDAVFTLYYRMPVSVIVSLSFLSIAYAVGFRHLITMFLSGMLIVLLPFFVQTVLASSNFERGRALEQSGILSVLEIVDSFPDDRVVLAPLSVSDLVPVLTRHTSFLLSMLASKW